MSKIIAKFEKVSLEQFHCSVKNINDMLLHHVKGDEEIKKAYDELPLPKRATASSAGYDFCIPYDLKMIPGKEYLIPTGIRCKMEDGYVLEMYPRSSFGFKNKFRLSNTVGIIDADYYNANNEGHIMLKVSLEKNCEPLELKKYDRIAQGIFKEYFLAEEDEVTTERTGGIGSTGV